MTTAEVAERLGIAQSSVARLIYKGVLQAEKFANVWMVDKKSVDDYIERNKGKSTHDPTRRG